MNNRETIIQISRSGYIERDRGIAVLRLDQHYFEVGEPVMVRYYVDPDTQEETDTLIAMGKRNGQGKDCYEILSLGGLELVQNIVSELPDVSELVHGEVYLWQDLLTRKWYRVYEFSSERQIEELNCPPTIFVNIADRYKWYWKDNTLKREDDFFTAEETNQFIDQLINMVIPPTLEVNCLDGYLFESGTKQDITFYIKVKNYNDVDITSDCSILVDNTPVTLDKDNCYYLRDVTLSHDYKVTAKFTSNNKEYLIDTVVKIRFGYYIYYGVVGEDWKVTETNVKLLQNSKLVTREDITWSNISLEKQKTVFAYPKIFGLLSHIYDDNGLCYIPDYTVYELELVTNSNIQYCVYVKNEIIQTNDFLQIFKFISEDLPGEIIGERYDKVIEAWNKANTTGGMVILESGSKIPQELIPNLGKGTYVGLVNMLPQYPTYGIRPGYRWYNTTTKKIFVGVGTETGKIEEPESEVIYINLSDGSLYIWKNGDMISVGGSMVSTKINKISEIL